ncbi:CLUMA_CG001277, isoform A [Clunio marinus]|uniref:CLUMA_CG001277, isoform A n=1 Tax=Clunio marinus TaxID=568069 RepID=A0A1J1HJ88_9DIPT|nr:CLUMA_CG001277, isoform A [Clunio marinus]
MKKLRTKNESEKQNVAVKDTEGKDGTRIENFDYKRSLSVYDAILLILILLISLYCGIFMESQCPENDNQLNELTYWLFKNNYQHFNESFKTVQTIFDQLGFKMVNGSRNESWNIMWSEEFPFENNPDLLAAIKPNQLINHFPGITYLTNKKYLALSSDSKYIPTAFDLPRLKNEFIYYQRANLSKRFVVKNWHSRGIRIIDVKTMDFQLGQMRYVQEFVDNPLLIDDRAFDVGVYVLITSLDPLRFYRYKGDILLRLCADPYYPFDPENVNSYVVNDKHLPYWEAPSFVNTTKQFKFSALDSLNLHLSRNGHNVKKFWKGIDDAIMSVILSKTERITLFTLRFFKAQAEYFELLRFDFLIDDSLSPHLMEINISPNLTPTSESEEPLRIMYEQILYNTLTLVANRGELIERLDFSDSKFTVKTVSKDSMLSSKSNLVIHPEICENCLNSCNQTECELCTNCLSQTELRILQQAYREHQRRAQMMRMFPSKAVFEPNRMKKLSNSTQLTVKWFLAKCEVDEDWC